MYFVKLPIDNHVYLNVLECIFLLFLWTRKLKKIFAHFYILQVLRISDKICVRGSHINPKMTPNLSDTVEIYFWKCNPICRTYKVHKPHPPPHIILSSRFPLIFNLINLMHLMINTSSPTSYLVKYLFKLQLF